MIPLTLTNHYLELVSYVMKQGIPWKPWERKLERYGDSKGGGGVMDEE